ncbi:MAG TPA: hypothetical protein VGU01_11225 [Sphingomicrobium sp.]|nr:hypothetical protein [Sphingomicrobium sp.]
MKLFLLGVALASSTHPGARFDLVCSGSEEHVDSSLNKPYTAHYRIDLAAKRFCMDMCKATIPITDVQPNVIVLERSGLGEPKFEHLLDRQTGEDTILMEDEIDKGTCQRQPFSGFSSGPKKF